LLANLSILSVPDEVIPETRRAHNISFLRFDFETTMRKTNKQYKTQEKQSKQQNTRQQEL
jgi:hypothetical protein